MIFKNFADQDWIEFNFIGSGLDRIQFYRIRTGLGLKNFAVRSSLVCGCPLVWRTPRVDSFKPAELAYTRIENAHKVRKKTFFFIYVTIICTVSRGTEQIRDCMSCYDQSAQNRRQKVFTRGLYVCAGRLDIENILKSALICTALYLNLEALGLCLERRSPRKHPSGDGTEFA